MSELSREEHFLLQEYESATKLTYHIDELRNSITGFFLTFSGLAAAGLALLLKGEVNTKVNLGEVFFKSPSIVVAFLLLLVVAVGIIMVCILGRLRRAQVEHFGIINNIRSYFLRTNCELWDVVQLSAKTVPVPNRKSGTYLWTVLLIVVGSCLLSFCSFLFLVGCLRPMFLTIIAMAVFIASFWLQDRLYFKCASSIEVRKYDAGNLPLPQHLVKWINP